MAAAHIGQGSSVTQSQAGSRSTAARGGANGEDLGMGSRIVQLSCAVPRLRNHPARRIGQHRAHRHLAARGGGAGFAQREGHMRGEAGHASLSRAAPVLSSLPEMLSFVGRAA